MITYLKKLTDERDSLTAAATDLAEKAANEERDLTDTEKASLTAWSDPVRRDRRPAHRVQRPGREPAGLRPAAGAHRHPRRAGTPATERHGGAGGDPTVVGRPVRRVRRVPFLPRVGIVSQRVQVPWETRANLALADFPTALKTPYLHTVAPYRESTPLLDAIPQITVSSNSVEWVKWAPNPVPAASVVAEGAPKPEMAMTATAVSDTLETYAHWKGITRQALEDIPQVRSIIESRLRQGLARALDTAAVTALNAATYTGVVQRRHAHRDPARVWRRCSPRGTAPRRRWCSTPPTWPPSTSRSWAPP